MKIFTAITPILASVLMLLTFSACHTTDEITYFQNADQLPDTLINIPTQRPEIVPEDELSILVSAENMAAVAGFNKPVYNSRTSGDMSLSAQYSLQSYVVDPDGNIDFPTLGQIHVQGMKVEELGRYLKSRIEEYVKNPIVSVDLLSFPVLVLGEVNTPGTCYHNGKRATIMETIAKAHDLTIYGDRTNILLIREENGKRIKHRLDLTSADILTSPYFYVRQNDIIYVAPNQARRASANYNSMKQQNLSMISTIVSVISVLATLAVAIWK